ncbi:hypothetical protein SISNIDRAFT_494280 [Sistotremastrum niveocremeum HHB9708]|uniref:Nucleolar 27S pre-rRNA processing Urb2/Npa2 C-terminal domain-containing protein n=2 Tax=Sistotremastraceae TaxID=3402574 RepID=A0A164XNJ4_9AGAM|nr:hypothetical protein SISNIDRAFT_494280 [Sistotremastrum niveocremeum HHB9708]KZT44515.1 hypothetical protein SISSUDRAFT_1124025 [Sistotremastrum suecicum HHB10207 ss-3]
MPLSSSEAFIKYLKAPSDPPSGHESPKISVARAAWDSRDFYVPSKGEVITDWILTSFLKTRDAKISSTIFDIDYWELLAIILTGKDHSRPFDLWLPSLLNRISFGTILSSCLTSLSSIPSDSQSALSASALASVRVLWPLAVQKSGLDIVASVFRASLSFSCLAHKSSVTPSPSTINLLSTICTVSRPTLTNLSTAKKMRSIFLDDHLSDWVIAIFTNETTLEPSSLAHVYYSIVADIMFGIEALRIDAQGISEGKPAVLPQRLAELAEQTRQPVLNSLPHILESFLVGLERQGAGHSVQPSIPSNSKSVGLAFFEKTFEIASSQSTVSSWKATLHLLEVAEAHALISSRSSHWNGFAKIISAIESTLTGLYEKPDEDITITLDILVAISKIDIYVVLDHVPNLVSKLLTIPTEYRNSMDSFFEILFGHYCKIRSPDKLVGHIMEGIEKATFIAAFDSARNYRLAASGPLFTERFRTALASSLRTFLPTTLLVNFVRTNCAALLGFAQVMVSRSSQSSQKHSSSASERNLDELCIQFAISASLSSDAFSSIPLHSAGIEIADELVSLITTTYHSLYKCHEALGSERWFGQLLISSILRLRYTMITAPPPSTLAQASFELPPSMENWLQKQALSAELSFEVNRALLAASRTMPAKLDFVFQYLQEHLAPDGEWSGRIADMTDFEGHRKSSVALWSVLVDRWIYSIDESTSNEQLERLAGLILLTCRQSEDRMKKGVITPAAATFRLLRSASFWELRNLRIPLTQMVLDSTSVLAPYQTGGLIENSKTAPKTSTLSAKIDEILSTFRFLSLVPTDYLKREQRAELVKRAYNADVLIASRKLQKSKDQHLSYSPSLFRISTRSFISRIVAESSSPELLNLESNVLVHLMTNDAGDSLPSLFLKATQNLLQISHAAIGKLSTERRNENYIRLAQAYAQVLQDKEISILFACGLSDFLDLVSKPGVLSQAEFREEISALADLLTKTLSPILSEHEVGVLFAPEQLTVLEHYILLWRKILVLQRALGLIDRDAIVLGTHLLGSLAEKTDIFYPKNIAEPLLSLLLEEAEALDPQSRLVHLSRFVATFVFFAEKSALRTSSEQAVQRPDDLTFETTASPSLHFMFKRLSTDDHAALLDILDNVFKAQLFSESALPYLFELSSRLLISAPEGTSPRRTQHARRVLSMLADHEFLRLTRGPGSFVTRWIELWCTENTASLNLLDIGNIWAVISAVLHGSSSHEPETCHQIFHSTTMILTILVRTRRELVLSTLPHLTVILRKLLSAFRHVRKGLGKKQKQRIIETLPRWINPDSPLGSKEARALARLLTTIAAKHASRAQGVSDGAHKSESLSKPFSKHAPQVLMGYVQMLNDPLLEMPLELRKELEPGVLALCGMMTEYGRDAIMAGSSDAGEKTLLKTIWQKYEKQRYSGKG